MKKSLLVLAIVAALFSCSPEDKVTEICGKISTVARTCGHDGCTWYVFLHGHQEQKVDFDTYEYASRNRGKVMCIQPLPW